MTSGAPSSANRSLPTCPRKASPRQPWGIGRRGTSHLLYPSGLLRALSIPEPLAGGLCRATFQPITQLVQEIGTRAKRFATSATAGARPRRVGLTGSLGKASSYETLRTSANWLHCLQPVRNCSSTLQPTTAIGRNAARRVPQTADIASAVAPAKAGASGWPGGRAGHQAGGPGLRRGDGYALAPRPTNKPHRLR